MDHVFEADPCVKIIDDGRYSLKAVITKTNGGLCIYMGGGSEPHIGAVVISRPRLSRKGDGSVSCTTSVINFPGHKDDELAVPLAEGLSKALSALVVVTAGVHIENANDEDIRHIRKNSERLLRRILGSEA